MTDSLTIEGRFSTDYGIFVDRAYGAEIDPQREIDLRGESVVVVNDASEYIATANWTVVTGA